MNYLYIWLSNNMLNLCVPMYSHIIIIIIILIIFCKQIFITYWNIESWVKTNFRSFIKTSFCITLSIFNFACSLFLFGLKSGSQINLSSPLRLSTAFCANPLRWIYILQLSKNEKTEIIVKYIQFLLHIFNVFRSLTDILYRFMWVSFYNI